MDFVVTKNVQYHELCHLIPKLSNIMNYVVTRNYPISWILSLHKIAQNHKFIVNSIKLLNIFSILHFVINSMTGNITEWIQIHLFRRQVIFKVIQWYIWAVQDLKLNGQTCTKAPIMHQYLSQHATFCRRSLVAHAILSSGRTLIATGTSPVSELQVDSAHIPNVSQNFHLWENQTLIGIMYIFLMENEFSKRTECFHVITWQINVSVCADWLAVVGTDMAIWYMLYSMHKLSL
jgi:hypothetical protein